MSHIAWIGLGHMGAPMALNLLKAGHTVVGYDVLVANADALRSAGLQPAQTLAEAVSGADVIFTMLQTSDQVKAVCLSEGGIFDSVKKGAVVVDSSSIDIAVSQALHQTARERGLSMLDAPVSGGVAGATAGTLTIMVGGDATVFDQCHTLFQSLGKTIVHAGGPGHGQAAKICNNLILGVSMIGVCEAFNLAEKIGLDAQTFFEISRVSSGQCWSMTSYCPSPGILPNVPSSHNYQPGFMAKMMLKDLKLAKAAAQEAGASTPLGSHAEALYQQFVDAGSGEKDFSGIIQWLASLQT